MTATVLTVDDSRTMRDMLMMALSQAGFDVVQAVDGVDGIETLETSKTPDVIVTDINMPASTASASSSTCARTRSGAPRRSWC